MQSNHRERASARRFLLTAAVALLAACGGSGGGSPTDPGTPVPESQVESRSFQLLNQTRAEEGVPQLVHDPVLAQIARAYSADMRDRGFFSHVDPEGNGFVDRLRAGGVTFTRAAENLAMISNAGDPAGFAHQRFLQNPDHRANILDGRLTHAGVGVARRGSTYWITQLFVRP
ncbi:MAG TPA: CAP domain-containing protein [Thermoanaerobaculia bacterium]|nr:CAP domain-containing protein [Thermoanaerobaculia bacterium]